MTSRVKDAGCQQPFALYASTVKIKTHPPTYLFDGHCVLCSRAVQYILRHETTPEMRFVAITSAEGRELAQANDIDPDNPESFLIIEDDVVHRSSDALIVLARYSGGVHRIAVIGKVLPRPIRDWLYSLIAKNRYKVFGQTESCYVPDPENRHRFILS